MKLSELEKWDRRFINLASMVGTWSKGPRKRIGACIVRPDRSVASLGYNGPPRGFDDEKFLRMTREEQHKVVVHAEINALLQMHPREFGENLNEYTLYVTPLYPCERCANIVVNSNIRRVVAYCGHISDDWAESAKKAENIFEKAGVEFIKVV